MLETKQLSLTLGARAILNEVDFRVSRGEFVSLLGPNGAGKTTLLKAISGLIKKFSGEVLFRQKKISSYSPRQLAQSMALVPQEVHFDFPFTALQIVLMGRSAHQKQFSFDSKSDLQVALDCMQMTDCLAFKDQNIQTLSGGEKQRVLLARALAQDPEILILDEPASHLDIKHQTELFDLLEKCNTERGITLVTVMHDINQALRCTKRFVFMKEGKIALDKNDSREVTSEALSQIYGVRLIQSGSYQEKPLFFP